MKSASEIGGILNDDQVDAIAQAAINAYTITFDGTTVAESYLPVTAEAPASGSGQQLSDEDIALVAARAVGAYATDVRNEGNAASGLYDAGAGGIDLVGIEGAATASLSAGGRYVATLDGDGATALADVSIDTSDPDDIVLTTSSNEVLRLANAYGAQDVVLKVGEETQVLVDASNTTYSALDASA